MQHRHAVVPSSLDTTMPQGCKPRGRGRDRDHEADASAAPWRTAHLWALGEPAFPCPARSPCIQLASPTELAQTQQIPDHSGAIWDLQIFPHPPAIESLSILVPACSLPFHIACRKPMLPLGPSFTECLLFQATLTIALDFCRSPMSQALLSQFC